MKMRLLLLMVVCWGIFGWVTSAMSAQLTDELTATLSSKSDGDLTSVLVFMRTQLDVKAVATRHQQQRQTRQVTHRFLIEELRTSASTDQANIKLLLDEGLRNGEVKSYKTYWIANALQVEATKKLLDDLQRRTDIELITEDLPMQSLYYPPSQTTSGTTESQGAFVALHDIGADSMWALGYTGAGTLIASFDSGIKGDHPALINSYHGNHGYSAQQCWFDPIYGQTYPHWESLLSSGTHGTTTMGVMVGKDDATGDTVGVAFGADWISAMVVDVPHANFLEAFQWAADPDGDPNTIEDVPDVLNNSWGFKQSGLDCSDVFWKPIDNLEALGTVVIFAAGNEGPGPMSLRNPANRASTPYSNFAVGAVSPTNPDSIWSLSSRGPSDCDGVSIKPEVVAPGYQIRTTYPSVTTPYATVTGTSYAAPYVSGAVALLRQYNPNATVEEIKAALMNSAIDKGTPGEDNTFGWGLINIPAAMALLPPNNETNIYVREVSPDSVGSGQQTDIIVTLRNSGVSAAGVSGELINPDAGVTIIAGSVSFGDLATNASSSNSASPFKLLFAPSLQEGTALIVNLHLQGNSGSYQKDVRLHFLVGAPLIKSSYTNIADSCSFTVSNYGTYGLAPESISPHGGVGFVYPSNGGNNLFQCGVMIGVDSDHVSDGIVNLTGGVDLDFAVAPGGNLTLSGGGKLGDVVTTSLFNDVNAQHPLGINVEQHSANYSNSPTDSRYVIVQYIITNSSLTSIGGMYVGLYCDWDYPWGSGGSDRSNFARDLGLGYMWRNGSAIYHGTAVLNSEGVQTFYAIQNLNHIYSASGYGLVSEAAKYSFLTHGMVDTAGTGAYDQSYCIATGPFNLAPGQSDTAAFAMIGGTDLLSLRNSATLARDRYATAIGYVCGDADGSAQIDIADVVFLIAYIFGGDTAPSPLLAGDADCSLDVNVADAVYLINYIFSQGAAPCAACPK